MLKINFEFRKGIFFIRLIGNMNKHTFKPKEKEIKALLIQNNFKYIVLNVNYLKKIDNDSLNYFSKIYKITKKNKSNLVLCDKFQILNKLMKVNLPSIADELEVL